jgi:hypothetical protein
MQQKIYFTTPEERAAGEYLAAFIKHLFNKGKSGIEISKTLQISLTLLERLIYDEEMLAELKKRNDKIVWPIIKNTSDPREMDKKLREIGISWSPITPDTYYDGTGLYTTIGPWQRNHNFKNAVQYHYHYKKKYSKDDIDVILSLSTGVDIKEPKEKLPSRELTPEYKMRIVYDLLDGLLLQNISEKYNCSVIAVTQIAAENGLILPVTGESVAERIAGAVKEGYTLEQLTKRFIQTDEEKLKELIKIHRILPATE